MLRRKFDDPARTGALQAACLLVIACLTATGCAAEERCAGAPIVVTAASADESHLACSAGSDALHMLNRCGIAARRPIHVQISDVVRHPFSGPVFGLFDPKSERAVVTRFENIASLVRGTPFAELPQHEFHRSLIVHEIVHVVMHQNSKRQPRSHAAYEYPAYALQIESLSPGVRDKFLQSVPKGSASNDLLFNDFILFGDPFFFAARAYEHFKAPANPCSHLLALLEGEVAFIPALPLSQ